MGQKCTIHAGIKLLDSSGFSGYVVMHMNPYTTIDPEARIITKRARELCFDFPFGRRGLQVIPGLNCSESRL